MHSSRLHRGPGRTQLRPFASATKANLKTQPQARAPPHSQPAHINQNSSANPLHRLVSVAAALAITVGATSGIAHAVTTEQLLFLDAWRAVDRAYVDKDFNGQPWFRIREQYLKKESFNNRSETYAAIKKLLASLDDPFTRFLEPEKLAALRRGTQGAVTGVGVEITLDDNSTPLVMSPAPGGPAEQAGVKAGDRIVAVDGRPTQGLSLYEAGDLLQGPEGSEVTVSIIHSGGSSREELQMQRRRVASTPVQFASCGVVSDAVGAGSGTSVGYIRVATFNSSTTAAVQDAILQLQQQNVGAFVLDIRNNSGGVFQSGVNVAKMFVNSGDIVLIADSQGVRDIYSADGTAIEPKKPLAVLVNRGTASASEVLSGALKDNGRATIVGENTFGKGLIQTVVDLSDGSGLAITVAKYQTPGGIDINKIGIAPDIKVDPAALPAPGPEGVCKLLQADDAPRLYK